MRYLLVFLLLSALAWAEDSQAAAQVEMLKALFREPSERWTQMLEQKRNLLDRDFFIGVEQRLARDEMMGEWVDAARFARVGDLACRVVGRTPRYCAGLQAVLEKRGLGALDYGLEAELIEAGVGAPWKVVATRVERSPARSAKSLHRAEVEWGRGNLDVALRYFRDAAVQDPDSVSAHFRLGQYYSSLGQTGMAILELERAVALSPENAEAWLNLARLYELQFDAKPNLADWDHAVRAFSDASRPEEVRRLQARLVVCRARSVALSASGDWQIWIPSRRDDYRLGSLVGHWNDDDEDVFPGLEPTQASGALVWRGTRGGSLVWLRSRQPDTRLLRDGKLVLTFGGPRNPGWGKPAAVFRDRKRKSEILVYPGPSVDLGVEIEAGKVVGILLVEKGRLLREMRDAGLLRVDGNLARLDEKVSRSRVDRGRAPAGWKL